MNTSANEKTVHTKPGRTVTGQTGQTLIINIKPYRCIVDAHSHIENGACAPLPLLWDKSGLIRGKTREQIDNASTKGITGFLFSLLKGEAGPVQVMSTSEIGNRAVREMDSVFGTDSTIAQSDLYKNATLYSFTVVQMMDMEYAWLGGFDGQTIYHEDEKPWYFFKRENARASKDEWKKVSLPGEDEMTFQKWKRQRRETVDAIKFNPLRLLGMYHYDPRRWNYASSYTVKANFEKGPWDYPFKEIISANGKGLFIGFKMYPPLGYKPLDHRLPYLYDKSCEGDCFYGRCEKEKIPILVHCSPGGMYTHEKDLYIQYDGMDRQTATEEALPKETRKRLYTPDGYFWTNYVHPKGWREVLVRYPNLRICLAHFGGAEWEHGLESDWINEIIALTKEFPNVYTDFSCWDIDNAKDTFRYLLTTKQYAHLKKKILFGTDWYMTLVALGGKSYTTFCEEFWKFFQEIPDGMELWERFAFTNPFTFYGIFEKGEQGDKLDTLAAALQKNKCDEDMLSDNYNSIRYVQKYYEKFKGK